MLKIIYGNIDLWNHKYGTDYKVAFLNNLYFDNNYTVDWLNNPIAKQIIRDIDSSEHIQDNLIISPVFGAMPPTLLSGGCKSLISILNHPHIIQNASHLGDNCAHWLLKLAEDKDIIVQLEHIMRFDEFGDVKCNAMLMNTGEIYSTAKELTFAIAMYNADYWASGEEDEFIGEKTLNQLYFEAFGCEPLEDLDKLAEKIQNEQSTEPNL